MNSPNLSISKINTLSPEISTTLVIKDTLVLPKFLFLFIGVLVRFYKLLDFTDFYNNVVVFTQCIANFIILVNIIKLKIKLDNIYFFSAIVYCIIFSLSPIFAPRYLFPGYILFAMAIASHKSNLSLKSAIKNNKENVL